MDPLLWDTGVAGVFSSFGGDIRSVVPARSVDDCADRGRPE